MRSLAAAARAAAHEAERKAKAENHAKMIAGSASAVEELTNFVSGLTSIHTRLANRIDWHTLADATRPLQPVKQHVQRDRAQAALTAFCPSVFHIFRGGSAKVSERLEAQVQQAAAQDDEHFEVQLATYRKAVADWEDDTALARRLLDGEAAAIRQVIEEMQSLSENSLIGSEIEFSIGKNFVHARPKVHGDDIVPNVRRKQLASGRLSETKMPSTQSNELYQDYVASVALKTAGDLFQILPLDDIYVTCVMNMLNLETGHKTWTSILSVQFVRTTFLQLNLERIDPSDSLKNFKHAVKFSKTKGFSAVIPIDME